MRTTKTAKASIIRIAPPIVEEPSESLEPLKELFEKEETAYLMEVAFLCGGGFNMYRTWNWLPLV